MAELISFYTLQCLIKHVDLYSRDFEKAMLYMY